MARKMFQTNTISDFKEKIFAKFSNKNKPNDLRPKSICNNSLQSKSREKIEENLEDRDDYLTTTEKKEQKQKIHENGPKGKGHSTREELIEKTSGRDEPLDTSKKTDHYIKQPSKVTHHVFLRKKKFE